MQFALFPLILLRIPDVHSSLTFLVRPERVLFGLRLLKLFLNHFFSDLKHPFILEFFSNPKHLSMIVS